MLVYSLLFTGRPTLPMLVFEEHQCEKLLSSSPTRSPPHPLPAPVNRLSSVDWLLRDMAYSEIVTEHKQSGTCRDCLRFHKDGNDELQVSMTWWDISPVELIVSYKCVCICVLGQFAPVPPSWDVTCTDDLSSHDLTRLSFISHIELSTFLLALGIQTKRTRPARSKTRGALHFYIPVRTQVWDNTQQRSRGLTRLDG